MSIANPGPTVSDRNEQVGYRYSTGLHRCPDAQQVRVAYNAHALESIFIHVAPGLGWR